MKSAVDVEAIIQARVGSTRLPEKVFLKIGPSTILEWVIERLREVAAVERVVVATTNASRDDLIEKMAERLGVAVFRGEEDDVLDRFYRTLETYPAKTIVRATADNPLLDPASLEMMIRAHIAGGHDHTGGGGVIPLGLTAEVVSSSAINIAWRQTIEKPHREHVTPYIYTHPEMFRLASVPVSPKISGRYYRFTVDTGEDYNLMTAIHDRLSVKGLAFCAEEAVRLLDENPELAVMNGGVVQKDWRKELS
ncbi:MAG: NTP transferase domain-containing protein [Nitrospinae bacterium]|nr:NTP transferase domain-containing protein [Nitrospinota bacterium]MBF0634269.1 NTP transferase domain-containing protein [Nitrospinota bacterium]